MPRTIVLPSEFEKRLDGLVDVKQETNGVLLYRPQDNYCPIEHLFMTGIGHEGHVRADGKRIEVINEFFKRNPQYSFVKFHTHTKETIRKHGDYYSTHFSHGDIQGYKEQITENPEFIGMVVTPQAKLLYAIDKPTIQIANNFPTEADKRISDELHQIASARGITLEGLVGLR